MPCRQEQVQQERGLHAGTNAYRAHRHEKLKVQVVGPQRRPRSHLGAKTPAMGDSHALVSSRFTHRDGFELDATSGCSIGPTNVSDLSL